jgi:hypothetical protein
MQNVWFAAAAWMGLAFVASIVSIRIGISVALLEGAWAFTYWVSGWDYHGSLIAGIALSTTSVAVVYAVRGLGYGVLGTVNGLGDLFSSIIVGTLWTHVNSAAGFGYAAVLGLVGTPLVLRIR